MDGVDGAREWDRWSRRVSIFWKQSKKNYLSVEFIEIKGTGREEMWREERDGQGEAESCLQREMAKRKRWKKNSLLSKGLLLSSFK